MRGSTGLAEYGPVAGTQTYHVPLLDGGGGWSGHTLSRKVFSKERDAMIAMIITDRIAKHAEQSKTAALTFLLVLCPLSISQMRKRSFRVFNLLSQGSTTNTYQSRPDSHT